MIIDITKHIEHLQQIGKDRNLSVIIFTFPYQTVSYKCFYSLIGETITIAAEGRDIAINIPIKGNKLDNFLEEETYLKLKQIHEGELKTKIFCDSMLNAIMNLTSERALKINIDFFKACRTRVQNIGEHEKIYFYCWSRSFIGRKPTKKNLEKTKAFFGEEIYLICKMNNISSRWKDKPTKNSSPTSY